MTKDQSLNLARLAHLGAGVFARATIVANVREFDGHEAYDAMLDDIGVVKIGTLEYSAAATLREIDPTAYRCGYNDYMDSLENLCWIDGEPYDESEVRAEIESWDRDEMGLPSVDEMDDDDLFEAVIDG